MLIPEEEIEKWKVLGDRSDLEKLLMSLEKNHFPKAKWDTLIKLFGEYIGKYPIAFSLTNLTRVLLIDLEQFQEDFYIPDLQDKLQLIFSKLEMLETFKNMKWITEDIYLKIHKQVNENLGIIDTKLIASAISDTINPIINEHANRVIKGENKILK